jgi:calcineurin-like phosphoesterase family protein
MTIWFCSDHHLFHQGVLNFKRKDGTPLRSFSSVEEMNETILQRHNELVHPSDHVYFMGDVTFRTGREFDDLFNKFNGRKRLVVGNHDAVKNITNHFQKISCWRVFNQSKDEISFTVSHVPIHPGSVKGSFNVHGHTHDNDVTDESGIPDLRYVNLSMEKTDYRPISYDQLQQEMRERLTRQQEN